jgi:hypothetical protein
VPHADEIDSNELIAARVSARSDFGMRIFSGVSSPTALQIFNKVCSTLVASFSDDAYTTTPPRQTGLR